MKESISYSFLLNIIIIFIFTCAAIIMGILSYYKAFRANTIISNAIEKFEGYNCLSKEEISRKLNGLGYNTPFKVSCKNSDGKCDDSGESYKVTAYNLDFEGNLVYDDEKLNTVYICNDNGCATNKHYQYGIYTYMYVELPVVSKLIRILVFSKTSILYEFRNFYISDKALIIGSKVDHQINDVESIFDELYTKKMIDGRLYVNDAFFGKEVHVSTQNNNTRNDVNAVDVLYENISGYYTAKQVKSIPTPSFEELTMNITRDPATNLRTRAMIKLLTAKQGGTINALTYSSIGTGISGEYLRRDCGYQFDYSKIND